MLLHEGIFIALFAARTSLSLAEAMSARPTKCRIVRAKLLNVVLQSVDLYLVALSLQHTLFVHGELLARIVQAVAVAHVMQTS